MPYFLAEDPTMPANRANELLRSWVADKPWDHYPDSSQSNAVKALCQRTLQSN